METREDKEGTVNSRRNDGSTEGMKTNRYNIIITNILYE